MHHLKHSSRTRLSFRVLPRLLVAVPATEKTSLFDRCMLDSARCSSCSAPYSFPLGPSPIRTAKPQQPNTASSCLLNMVSFHISSANLAGPAAYLRCVADRYLSSPPPGLAFPRAQRRKRLRLDSSPQLLTNRAGDCPLYKEVRGVLSGCSGQMPIQAQTAWPQTMRT